MLGGILRKLLSIALAAVFGFLTLIPSASGAEALTVKFTIVGEKSYIHDSMTYVQLEFSGPAIATSANCATFLANAGSQLGLSLSVSGKESSSTYPLSSALMKTISLSRTALVCDFLFEGLGRDLYFAEPVGDLFAAAASVAGKLKVKEGEKSLAEFVATVVNFDHPLNQPTLAIRSPQRLQEVGRHFLAELDEGNTQFWVEDQQSRVELCDLSSNCEYPGYQLTGSEARIIMQSEDPTMGVFLDPDTLAISAPVGQFQLSVMKSFRIKTVPLEYLPRGYCDMIYSAMCAYPKGLQVFESVERKAPTLTAGQVQKIENVSKSLNLTCPKNLGTSNLTCVVTYDSNLGAFPVSSTETVSFCLWKNPVIADGCNQSGRYKPTFSSRKSVTSGGSANFVVPAKLFSGFNVVEVRAETNGDNQMVRYIRPAAPPKVYKPLTVSVNTSAEVIFGETHTYSISTKPAISGTCNVYRASNGMLYKVATHKLVNGRALGSHRWLWDFPGSTTLLSLTVDCLDKTYGGTGYALVRGYR